MSQEYYQVSGKISPKIGERFEKTVQRSRVDKRVAFEQALTAWADWRDAQDEALKKAGLLNAKVVS